MTKKTQILAGLLLLVSYECFAGCFPFVNCFKSKPEAQAVVGREQEDEELTVYDDQENPPKSQEISEVSSGERYIQQRTRNRWRTAVKGTQTTSLSDFVLRLEKELKKGQSYSRSQLQLNALIGLVKHGRKDLEKEYGRVFWKPKKALALVVSYHFMLLDIVDNSNKFFAQGEEITPKDFLCEIAYDQLKDLVIDEPEADALWTKLKAIKGVRSEVTSAELTLFKSEITKFEKQSDYLNFASEVSALLSKKDAQKNLRKYYNDEALALLKDVDINVITSILEKVKDLLENFPINPYLNLLGDLIIFKEY